MRPRGPRSAGTPRRRLEDARGPQQTNPRARVGAPSGPIDVRWAEGPIRRRGPLDVRWPRRRGPIHRHQQTNKPTNPRNLPTNRWGPRRLGDPQTAMGTPKPRARAPQRPRLAPSGTHETLWGSPLRPRAKRGPPRGPFIAGPAQDGPLRSVAGVPPKDGPLRS